MKKTSVLLLALLVLGAPGACSSEGPEESAADGVSGASAAVSSSGRLVIIGGALDAGNAPVYRAVLDGREGSGPVCVIPTASGEPEASMQRAVDAIRRYGGPDSARGVLISTAAPERARDASVAAQLEACGGYFFTGGSQSRIVDVFLPDGERSAAYGVVRARWEAGAVLAGTSAGAAMMSRTMISGGGSDEAMSRGVARGGDADGVEVRAGMDFFEPLLDQHFLARGRIGRLLVAVADPDLPAIGLGIDENTALVVDGGVASVVGASGVVVVDGRAARRTDGGAVADLRVTLAGVGDVIDVRTWEVTRPDARTEVTEVGDAIEAPADPFERWAFAHLVADLASSRATEMTFELPARTMRVREGPGFSATSDAGAPGVDGLPGALSAGPFLVDLGARR